VGHLLDGRVHQGWLVVQTLLQGGKVAAVDVHDRAVSPLGASVDERVDQRMAHRADVVAGDPEGTP